MRARGRARARSQRRLRELSDRYRGAGVVAMRTQPIPHAYRAFFRQVGLDPDATRIPAEAGGGGAPDPRRLRAAGPVADALLIALVETGVPVWALDGAVVDAGRLGIRSAVAGDRLGRRGLTPRCRRASWWWRTRGVHATLFGEPAPGHAPGPRTSGSCCSRWGSTAYPRSTSRRRCGWPPTFSGRPKSGRRRLVSCA